MNTIVNSRLKSITVFLVIFIITDLNAQLINRNFGFENGSWQNEWRDSNKRPVSDSNRGIELVEDPTRVGKYSLRFYHQDYKRCEIVPNYYDDYKGNKIIPGHFLVDEEYWLGVSLYLKDWNTNPSEWNTLLQTHGTPYENDWSCGAGHNGMTIYTTWDYLRRKNFLKIHAEEIKNAKIANSGSSAIGDPVWEIPCPENQWLDFVFHFKYSYSDDGFIKVWFNGELIVDLSGSTCYYLDKCGRPRDPRYVLKIGSYKEEKKFNYREMFVDEIRIGGEDASYQDVTVEK